MVEETPGIQWEGIGQPVPNWAWGAWWCFGWGHHCLREEWMCDCWTVRWDGGWWNWQLYFDTNEFVEMEASFVGTSTVISPLVDEPVTQDPITLTHSASGLNRFRGMTSRTSTVRSCQPRKKKVWPQDSTANQTTHHCNYSNGISTKQKTMLSSTNPSGFQKWVFDWHSFYFTHSFCFSARCSSILRDSNVPESVTPNRVGVFWVQNWRVRVFSNREITSIRLWDKNKTKATTFPTVIPQAYKHKYYSE